jgi:spermidine/putrescine transport system permease protein
MDKALAGPRRNRARRFSPLRITSFNVIATICFFALYLPIGTLALYSFNDGASPSKWEGGSLKWFRAAWNDEAVREVASRSLSLAAVAAIVATTCATFVAIATTRTDGFRGMSAIYGFVNMPLIVPEIVTGISLLIFFSIIKRHTGYAGMGYLYASHAAFCIPFAFLPIRARLQTMDLALERAAQDLYASGWQTFRHITLPLLRPGILAGFMLAFVTSLDDVVITELVKSAGQETLPTFMLGQLRRNTTPEVNAISVVFLLISILAVTAFFFLSRDSDR